MLNEQNLLGMERMNKPLVDWSFEQDVQDVPTVGREHHVDVLVRHAQENLKYLQKWTRDLETLHENEKDSAIVISAGPGIHKFNSINRIKDSGYKGKIIAVDGAYFNCLKRSIIPDYVLSLDPHPRRVVRWFGSQFQ